MSDIVVVHGTVSHSSTVSHTFGSSASYGGYGSGTVKTRHVRQFRINNRPMSMKGTPQIGDGDNVSVAGVETKGGFAAYALRNRSTQLTYEAPTRLLKNVAYGIALLALCMLYQCTTLGGADVHFTGFLIGLVPFSFLWAFAWWARGQAQKMKRANAMLAALP